jgi:UDP-glucose 4-epimerase
MYKISCAEEMNHTRKTILVTGGAGFIGSNLIPILLNKDSKVIVLDNLSTGTLKNLKQVETHPNLTFKEGDIRNPNTVHEVMGDVDVVVHLAAQIDVSTSVRDPLETHEINVTGTLNLLQEATKCKVQKCVFASSTAVYGDTAFLPIKEDAPLKPISPYAASKSAGEAYLSAFANCFGLETVSLRFFNVFGKKNQSNGYSGVITKFLLKAQANETLLVEGDGEQTRDFIHVSDVVEGILRAIETKTQPGEIFNICTGKPVSVNLLAESIGKIVGKKLCIAHGPSRIGDIRQSYGDPSKAKAMLGFQAAIDLSSGLKMMTKT